MSGENETERGAQSAETQYVVTTGIDFGTREVTVFSMRDPAPMQVFGVTSKHPVRYVPYPGWQWVERDGAMHHEPIDAALAEPAP